MLDRVWDWWMKRSIRTERSLVMQAGHSRWWFGRELVFFAVTVVAWVFWPWTLHTFIGVLCAIVVGLGLARGGTVSFRRAWAFRSGWIEGRRALWVSMVEAQRRGMTPQEWATAEMERDFALMGTTLAEVLEELAEEDDGPVA